MGFDIRGSSFLSTSTDSFIIGRDIWRTYIELIKIPHTGTDDYDTLHLTAVSPCD